MQGIKEQVALVVKGLGDLADRVVFVGGAIPVFYVDQDVYEEARPTEDIDCVIEVLSHGQYQDLEEQLRAKGFKNDPSMIARWNFHGLTVDVMPSADGILGFSNSWYEEALRGRVKASLPNGSECWIISSPCFLACKFEALRARGGDDWRMAKDLEDIIYLINGCDSIIGDIKESTSKLKDFLVSELKNLREHSQFEELLEANLSVEGRARRAIIIEKIESCLD